MNKLLQSSSDIPSNSLKRLIQYYHGVEFHVNDADSHKLEEYRSLFTQIDQVSLTAMVVVDYYHHNFLFTSGSLGRMLGVSSLKPEDITDASELSLHPHDGIIIDSIIRAREYLNNQAVEERKNYRLINKFRLCKRNGECIRLVVQHSILELDDRGNIWLGLRKVDLDPQQGKDVPALSCLQHVSTNECIYTMQGSNQSCDLSKREKEVLELIARGYVSKQIARNLFISEHTVNNHRKHILRKLKAHNTSEAIKVAVRAGILN